MGELSEDRRSCAPSEAVEAARTRAGVFIGEVKRIWALRVAPFRYTLRAGGQDAPRRAAPKNVAASVNGRAVDGNAGVSGLDDASHRAILRL